MKYKITKTDLLINNKLHPEGTEIELTKEQTRGIEDYLLLLNSKEIKNNQGTLKIKTGIKKSALKNK